MENQEIKKCCKYCNDGHGESIFPYYGVAPTVAYKHDGDTVPVYQFPPNFEMDGSWLRQSVCGTYTHCNHCGAGKPPVHKPTKELIKYQINPKTFTQEDVEQAIHLAANILMIIPVEFINRVANIESSLRYWISRGDQAGLFQMGSTEFEKFRLPHHNDRLNPYHNAVAATNYMTYHIMRLADRGIRGVSGVRLYLCHQQGLGGCCSIFEAAEKGIEVSETLKRNMLNNPAPNGKPPTDNPKQFIENWKEVLHIDGVSEILVTTFTTEAPEGTLCPLCSNLIVNPSFNSVLDEYYCSPVCRSDAMYHGGSNIRTIQLLREGKATLQQIKELTVNPDTNFDSGYFN